MIRTLLTVGTMLLAPSAEKLPTKLSAITNFSSEMLSLLNQGKCHFQNTRKVEVQTKRKNRFFYPIYHFFFSVNFMILIKQISINV
ncbi:hypothetical protein Ahy_A06g030127 isoform B [Arachis hypogaea]|uniref:Uncharacterized protein n=1 Tax=Arachis hypogaea TaxID=3818 RepID=A0A445CVB8_ARAHY|nr:hypothetical protein Ahy_A06g030127 isoform B [Arachis hypogaea]